MGMLLIVFSLGILQVILTTAETEKEKYERLFLDKISLAFLKGGSYNDPFTKEKLVLTGIQKYHLKVFEQYESNFPEKLQLPTHESLHALANSLNDLRDLFIDRWTNEHHEFVEKYSAMFIIKRQPRMYLLKYGEEEDAKVNRKKVVIAVVDNFPMFMPTQNLVDPKFQSSLLNLHGFEVNSVIIGSKPTNDINDYGKNKVTVPVGYACHCQIDPIPFAEDLNGREYASKYSHEKEVIEGIKIPLIWTIQKVQQLMNLLADMLLAVDIDTRTFITAKIMNWIGVDVPATTPDKLGKFKLFQSQAQIVNLSFSLRGGTSKILQHDPSQMMMLNALPLQGKLLIHAIGNKGVIVNDNTFIDRLFIAGAGSKILNNAFISVISLESNGITLSPFTTQPGNTILQYHSVCAVGNDVPILTIIFGEAESMVSRGTSFSAPIVASIAANILSEFPNLTVEELFEAITNGALPILVKQEIFPEEITAVMAGELVADFPTVLLTPKAASTLKKYSRDEILISYTKYGKGRATISGARRWILEYLRPETKKITKSCIEWRKERTYYNLITIDIKETPSSKMIEELNKTDEIIKEEEKFFSNKLYYIIFLRTKLMERRQLTKKSLTIAKRLKYKTYTKRLSKSVKELKPYLKDLDKVLLDANMWQLENIEAHRLALHSILNKIKEYKLRKARLENNDGLENKEAKSITTSLIETYSEHITVEVDRLMQISYHLTCLQSQLVERYKLTIKSLEISQKYNLQDRLLIEYNNELKKVIAVLDEKIKESEDQIFSSFETEVNLKIKDLKDFQLEKEKMKQIQNTDSDGKAESVSEGSKELNELSPRFVKERDTMIYLKSWKENLEMRTRLSETLLKELGMLKLSNNLENSMTKLQAAQASLQKQYNSLQIPDTKVNFSVLTDLRF